MFNPKFAGHPSPVRVPLTPLVAALLLLLPPFASARAAVTPTSPPDQSAILRQARELLQEAENEPAAARQAANLLAPLADPAPRSAEVALLLAEAWYRAADPDPDIEKSYPFFEKAGHYARLALKIDPQQWSGHYWLGLSELRKAQKVGGLRAYLITRRAIEELEEVSANRPGYDFGGAPRVLCHLYRVAPSWTPFGDIDKSIAYGKQAVRVAPDYARNHFYLALAYLKANNKAAAVAQLRKVLELLPNPLVGEARRQLRSLGETAQ
jgi:tetratricopeptide (TPR) repeat protein